MEEKNIRADEFRLIFENHHAVMLLVDPESGAIIDGNQAAVHYYGYSREELRKMNVSDIHPADPAILEATKLSIGNRLQDNILLQHRLANGEIRTVEVYSSPIQLDGKIIHFSIIHDVTERKKAEDALRESEVNYRNLFNSVSDAIYIQDENGRFLDVNNGAQTMYGYGKEFFIGKTPESVSAPGRNDLQAVALLLKKAFEGEVQKFDFWGIRKNGEIFPKEVNLYPGKLNNRKVVVALAQDITHRKRAELIHNIQYNIADAMVNARNLAELFESVRTELNSLIDTTNFLIALYDESTGMLSAPFERDENDSIPVWSASRSLTGYVISQRSSILIGKSDYFDLVAAGAIDVIGTPAEQWLGVPLIIHDKVIGAIVIQSYDNPKAFSPTSVEILEMVANQLSIYIERKRAEENAMRLSKAISQSPVSIVITDAHGNIEYVNPKFTDVTGYSPEEVTGKNQRILKSGEHTLEFYRDLWNTLLSGKDWQGEFHNRDKYGKLYWERSIISPIHDDQGRITHFVGVKEDITEKKKIMEDLIAAKERAEESDRLKSSFLANVSHEIRTPMNAIIGFSSLLNDGGLDQEKIGFYTGIIQKQAFNLLSIIDDILDLSKIEAGQMASVETIGDINELLLDIYNTYLGTRHENNNHSVEFILDNQLHGSENTIVSDFKWLRQILTNLVGNAFKFTMQGRITLGCRLTEERELEFYVRDTGIGISPEKQEIIFERFRQADETKTREYGGTGLGLAISRGLVELLGGKMKLESEPGKGSTFSFTIPYRPAMAGENKLHETPGGSHYYNWQGKTVLIVEDDEYNFEFMRTALQDTKINILHTSYGKEGIEMALKYQEIDIVLLDIRLPDIEGYEVVGKIKSVRPSLPVIAQTAYASEDYRRLCLDSGCNGYLSKPMYAADLLQTIHSFFSVRSAS